MENLKSMESKKAKRFNLYWGPYDKQELVKGDIEETAWNLLSNEEGVLKNCFQEMNKKIKELNFKSYYMRINHIGSEPIELEVDYGSHTRFFYVKEMA